MPTPEEIINNLSKDIRASLVDKFGELEKWKEKHDKEFKAFGDANLETKNALASITKDISNLNAKISDILQKGARKGGEPDARLTLGQQALAHEKITAFREAGGVGFTGKIPVVLGVTLTKDNAGAPLVAPHRIPDIKGPGLALFAVRNLFAPGTTGSNSIEFIREKVFTNKAAGVAEGTLKPQSSIEFEPGTEVVRTVAHWIPVSKQLLDDASQLESYIDARMLYGLSEKEEDQLINGDGTGQNLNGIVKVSTAYDTALTEKGDSMIDVLANAILQVRLANFPANGIILHPKDAHRIKKLKDSIGRYMFVDPQSADGVRPWGLQVVESTSIPEGKFSVGAYQLAGQVFDRQGATIEFSEHDQDNFVKNTITIRCEERLALVTYRPKALIYGTFPTTEVASSSTTGNTGDSGLSS